jgi:hypothetical protein
MSTSTITTVSKLAGAAVPPYRLVKLSTGKVIVTTAKADDAFGITGVDGASGLDSPCLVQMSGHANAVAADAIAVGAKLMPAADGKVITHDDSATAKYVGYALTAAGADGDRFEIALYDNKNQVKDAIA